MVYPPYLTCKPQAAQMTSMNLPTTLIPTTAASLLREYPTARILDVRTPGEFEAAHIGGAYNVPLDTIPEHAQEIGRITDAPILLVCQSGQRARRADASLRTIGMSNIHVLDGGMNAWIAAGLGVVEGRKRISLERQVRIVAGAIAATGGFLALAVNPLFAALPAAVGSGLVFAGVTDSCAMGMLLSRLKYNRAASCDPAAVVQMLTNGMKAPAAPAEPAGRTSATA